MGTLPITELLNGTSVLLAALTGLAITLLVGTFWTIPSKKWQSKYQALAVALQMIVLITAVWSFLEGGISNSLSLALVIIVTLGTIPMPRLHWWLRTNNRP